MIKRVGLALASLVLVCGLAELVLRATHLFNARLAWTEPDREIAWRYTPGREYWFFSENDHPIQGHINRDGWRDHERAPRSAPGMTRMAVLGDSFVEAFQVELDSTFVAILERTLNARAGRPAYEVMNFGRSGMSPAEELIVLERDIIPRDPDIVLLVFTPHNDIADVSPATAADPCRPFYRLESGDSLLLDTGFTARRDFRLRERISPLKQRSALVSLLAERFNAARLSRAQRGLAPAGDGLTREQRLCTAAPDSAYAANYALCRALLARMAARCSQHGIRFILTAAPLVYEADEIGRIRARAATFDPGYFDRDLEAFAGARGMEFIPLGGPFRESHRKSGALLHWSHWNYAGHRLVAREVAGWMAERAGDTGRASGASD